MTAKAQQVNQGNCPGVSSAVLFFYKSLYGKIRLDKDLEVITANENI